jgi:hypothetical protein
MMVYLYDNTGEYQGCTHTPEEHSELNYTQTQPPGYDDFTEKVFFVDGVWEIRNIDA